MCIDKEGTLSGYLNQIYFFGFWENFLSIRLLSNKDLHNKVAKCGLNHTNDHSDPNKDNDSIYNY